MKIFNYFFAIYFCFKRSDKTHIPNPAYISDLVLCIFKVLVGIPEGMGPLGRPRRRWEDNIKMDLQEVGGSCEEWMELAQDRDSWQALVGTVRNFRVPKMRGIFD